MADWKQEGAQRNDIKKVLIKTKEFAEMYLTVIKEKRDQWQAQLEKQQEEEKESNG